MWVCITSYLQAVGLEEPFRAVGAAERGSAQRALVCLGVHVQQHRRAELLWALRARVGFLLKVMHPIKTEN